MYSTKHTKSYFYKRINQEGKFATSSSIDSFEYKFHISVKYADYKAFVLQLKDETSTSSN